MVYFPEILTSPNLLIAFLKSNVQPRISERLAFMEKNVLTSELTVTSGTKIHHEVPAYNLTITLAFAWSLSDKNIRLNDEALLLTQQKREMFSDTHLILPRLDS